MTSTKKTFLIKFWKGYTDEEESIDTIGASIVEAIGKKSAIKKFIDDDTYNHICTIARYDLDTTEFKNKYAKLAKNKDIQNFIQIYNDNNIEELFSDYYEVEKDLELYMDFIDQNLDLIIKVLLLLDEEKTSFFRITEYTTIK